MKTAGKVTARMRERVLELAQTEPGRRAPSNRAIAATLAKEGLELSHVAVGDIRKRAGLAGTRGAPRRQKAPPLPVAPPPAPEPDDADEEATPDSAPAPDEEDEDLDQERAALDALLARRPEALPRLPPDATLSARAVWWDLVQVRAEVAAMRPKVRTGALPATQWLALVKEATRLAKELATLLPPPPPDAAKDPANIAARALVHAHVLQGIEAAEARCGRLCTRCREEVQEGRAA